MSYLAELCSFADVLFQTLQQLPVVGEERAVGTTAATLRNAAVAIVGGCASRCRHGRRARDVLY